ncbi:replication factor C subunit 1 [Lolium perenne]|uniref:replication factor C subunit 1 n=1 Tax=Lolium perenne TaxID=4522 RepID=UPI0021F64563|nr:replication factor C subunit 1-like [Lolium perenne]
MSSDIRKWFMKPHDKNAGAAKPSGTGTGAAAAAKKPVLSIPEKPAPSSVSGSQDASARRKTSKYFAPKTEKDSDVTGKSLPKRKLHKSSDQLEDDSKPLAANRVPKDEEEDDDDDDFVTPSKRKTPVKPPPSKKLKAASNDDDEDERMDEDAKTPSKAAGRGRGRGRGGRGAVHAKTATPDDDVGGGEDRMDEDAKTPSKSTGRGRGRGRGGRGGGTAHGKTTGLDDDAEEDRMDEDDKTPSKAAGRGRGGRGAGSTPGGRGRGGGGRGFMNFGERKDPPHKGEKEVPEGAPDCLAGLTFVISGTLDSLEREEAGDVIKRYGGRVTGSISKKTNYLLADEDVGGVKSNKAKDLGVPFLTEDGLFDMIRKSKPAKAPANKHENNSNSEKLQKSQTKSSPVKVEKRAVEQVSTMDKSIASKSEIASTNNQKAKVVDRGSLQWTEKYRPKVPNDIVGNQSMVKQLHDWLKSWEEQFLHPGQKGKGKKQTDGGAKKAVLLSGPPGIGKTTTAKVVSQMLGLQAIEVNASDSRGKADSKIEKGVGGSTSNSIKELISNATLNYSDNRTKKPKAVLIMDEVDGMSAGDRGGVADLIASIKISKIPIVCICNDRFSQKLKSLVNYCLLLNFRKPTKQQMGKRLMEIARKEGIQAQENAMEELAERVHGDIRMALNHLQYMSLSQSVVKYDDIRLRLNSSAKDEDISPFTAVDKLFGFNGGRLRMDERMDLSMSDPDLVPLIIQENYINYRPSAVGKDDSGVKRMNYLARAAESLADGDIVNVQIRRYRQWQLSQAACFASSIVPAALMHGNREVLEAGERNFNRFGGWLGKYSTTNKNKRLMEDVHSHILASQQANVDREALRLDYLTLLLRQLTGPLKTMPKDEAVQKVVEFMDTYCLTQEDFDTLVELSKFKGHPNPMDGIQPAVKSALTKAYKQGSSCRVIRSADQINIPGMKKTLKKRVAAILEPLDESLPEENGASAEGDEDEASDAENDDELAPGDSKPTLDLQSDKKKGIQVQLDLKTNGNGSSAKKAPAKSKASGSAGKAAGGSAGKRKR